MFKAHRNQHLCKTFLPVIAQLWIAALLVSITHAAPAVSTGLLAEGSVWQTRYYIMDSNIQGPTVLITGGMHGNEPSGYRSAEQIRHWPIVKGKLIVIPQSNVLGLKANTRNIPDEPKDRKNLNRNFPGDDQENKARGVIAKAIWQFTQKQKPDWVLDLHEGYQFNKSHKPSNGGKKSVGSSIIYFKGPQMDPLVMRMQKVLNDTIEDPDRKFTLLGRGPVNTGFARACIRKLGAKGFILETTSNFQPLSTRTRQHRMMVNIVMRSLEMIDRDCVDILTPTRKETSSFVGLYDAGGTGSGGVKTLTRIFDAAPNITVHHLGPADIQSDTLKRFDAIVFPGGSGSKEAYAIGKTGRENIRTFVRQGGGYLGICAGAFLCSSHYSWSLHLVNTSTFTGAREIPGKGKKQMWYRGKSTTVKMQLTEAGRKIFPAIKENIDVRYHNGPIVSPKKDTKLTGFTPLAYFRSEQVLYEPQRGTMINTPAILSGQYHQGRIISISPHPESTKGLESIITQSIEWISKKAGAKPQVGTSKKSSRAKHIPSPIRIKPAA